MKIIDFTIRVKKIPEALLPLLRESKGPQLVKNPITGIHTNSTPMRDIVIESFIEEGRGQNNG